MSEGIDEGVKDKTPAMHLQGRLLARGVHILSEQVSDPGTEKTLWF